MISVTTTITMSQCFVIGINVNETVMETDTILMKSGLVLVKLHTLLSLISFTNTCFRTLSDLLILS